MCFMLYINVCIKGYIKLVMRSDFKTVIEALNNFNTIDDYFDKSKTYNVSNYMINLRSRPKRKVMNIIKFILKYMVVLTDKKTNKVIEFDDSMLNIDNSHSNYQYEHLF